MSVIRDRLIGERKGGRISDFGFRKSAVRSQRTEDRGQSPRPPPMAKRAEGRGLEKLGVESSAPRVEEGGSCLRPKVTPRTRQTSR